MNEEGEEIVRILSFDYKHCSQQGSLLFSKFEFSIKPDLRDLSFLCIRWPYAVFYKMQIVFYKSVHFMYL